MGWRAAGPAPSFPPAPSNRNLLQCCGEQRGRGSRGGLAAGRASPRLAEGRREGARRGRPLAPFARSLVRSFPPSGRRVSQSVSPPAARGASEPQRPEPRTPAPSPAIVRLAAAAAGARSPGPTTTGEARLWRRASGAGVAGWGARGAVPEGTVLEAAAAPPPLCLQPLRRPGPGARAARPQQSPLCKPAAEGFGAGTRSV